MFNKNQDNSPLEEEEEDFEYYETEEDSVEEEVEEIIPEAPKGFKETFPKIEDLTNAWRKGDKEEIAKLAGSKSSDLATLKNIWKNA